MITTLFKSAYKHGYLFVASAVLYVLSFFVISFLSYTSSPRHVKIKFEEYISSSEKSFSNICSDTASLGSLLNNSATPNEELFIPDGGLSFYIYSRNEGNLTLDFWSTHVVIPKTEDLQKADGKYFVKYANGEFELIKKSTILQNKRVIVAGLVPIRHNYFWENEYLRTEFAAIHELQERYDLDTTNKGLPILNGDGNVLFTLKEKPKGKIIFSDYDSIPLLLKLLSIIFFLILINFITLDTVKLYGWKRGLFLLLTTIFILRFLTYKFNFPFDFRTLKLFDPTIYASNSLNRSLGDLLINVVLLFWIVSFLKTILLAAVDAMPDIKRWRGRVVTATVCIFLLAISFTGTSLIRSLIIDSNVSFDVSNFFGLSINTLISFIILCLIVLSFFYLSHILLVFAYKCTDVPRWLKYLLVPVFGLIYLSMFSDPLFIDHSLLLILWLLLYLFIFEYRKGDVYIPMMRSPFFLIWLILFAASIATLIIFQTRNEELEQRKGIAEKLAEQADPSGENLMSVAVSYFTNPFLLSNFHRFQSEISNKVIKDSLISANFSGYLNKYDTRLYTFDSLQNPLFNDDSTSYEVVTNIISNRSHRTKISNLYYYENSLDRFSYLFGKTIIDDKKRVLGYFFIVAKPKRYKSEALYPELFKEVTDISTDLNVNYSYAIYNKGEILTSFGDHDFPSTIFKKDYPLLVYEVKKIGNDNELWVTAANNKLVIISKKGNVLYDAITLFACLFVSFLFIIVLSHFGILLFRSKFKWRRISKAFRFSIRSQIQSTIIFISIFSFVVIGIATIKFYINRFTESNKEKLLRVITIMSKDIQNQFIIHNHFDDGVKMYEIGANSQLEASINTVSETHGVDVNFYDANGLLRSSTQPYIYNKHILSEMMEPQAYYQLHYNNNVRFINDEYVGRFRYVSIYVPIKSNDGQTFAYLNIPYLNSQNELNQEISNFLVTLITLNAFIFVLASAIALLLTNRIIRSFSLIGNKMKAINLGKYNEQITWKINDEIGMLVNEYNKMVKKLEESAQALAKSEREGAWREMARQVAHEIKNPLTPMKLSIQYLQRSIDENKPDVKDLAFKVSATLVEQIDQLAKIASDFSQFANIGNVKNEVFNVNDVIASLVDLYNTNENITVKWRRLAQPVLINADRFQVNRLLTNLVQNAIQASHHDRSACVIISEKIEDKEITISVHDEGQGIPADMHDKIFTPNFTTKSSGTGLGLAICKGIVEKANGRIWFVTSEGEGTTFYVKLPLAGN